jgi:two-component system, cell cycle sensor histidine kinase and response regulator CckA
MLNKLRHWPHAVLRREPLQRRQLSSLQIILLLFIGGLIGLPVGILTTSEIVTPIIPLICYSFLLGGIAAALAMLRRGHVSTEHRQVEAALRGSEEWLRLALDAAHMGIWEWNMLTGALTWSEHVEPIFGRAPGTFAGTATAYLALVHPADREAIKRVFDETLNGRQTDYTIEHRIIWPDGSLRWLELKGRVAYDTAGHPVHTTGTITDITARKRLEAQLLQAQKLESIGLLAGGIAHDFNNLLTAITGYTQLARDILPPDDLVRPDLDEILKAAGQAANLTRQLLAFARKQIIAPQVLDLNDLILNVEKLLRRLIGEDIDLTASLAPALGLVKVDPGQIEQVLMNLAVNARHAMPNGGRLTIETRDVVLSADTARQYLGMAPGAYVFLAITDTGVGMDHETLSHIFEPFFTTKGPSEGTGLGLATCYGIITQHGGHIAAYSELGHGTCFKIYLPRVNDAAEVVTPRHEQPALPRGSERVLVVEDDPAVRALTVRMLHQQGYRVLQAANGDEALRIVCEQNAETIALLVTDLVMPQMGGKHLAEQLAALHPPIKVMFMSGYTDTTIVQQHQLAPRSVFLQKPFSRALLAHSVREVLDS